jgi:hypothetical protein
MESICRISNGLRDLNSAVPRIETCERSVCQQLGNVDMSGVVVVEGLPVIRVPDDVVDEDIDVIADEDSGIRGDEVIVGSVMTRMVGLTMVAVPQGNGDGTVISGLSPLLPTSVIAAGTVASL